MDTNDHSCWILLKILTKHKFQKKILTKQINGEFYN